ncbi:MAG TPA: hypothetical protein IAA76_08690 [Candidatus Ornithospirochaeta stercorigallinarum]|nr:hypothetical protein [Candidatus Ornithospirochaeta stercorigallinarum]
MTVHEQLIQNWDAYIKENARYEEKGIKASKVRARKALMELAKLAKERRKELRDADTQEEE